MKFVSALFVLAVVFSVDASAVLPLPLAYTNQFQPLLTRSSLWDHRLVATKIISAPSAFRVAPTTVLTRSIPAAVELHAAPAIVHAAAPIALEGQYVAANRGSVHIATLPGHHQSASSINLEAAPGTW